MVDALTADRDGKNRDLVVLRERLEAEHVSGRGLQLETLQQTILDLRLELTQHVRVSAAEPSQTVSDLQHEVFRSNDDLFKSQKLVESISRDALQSKQLAEAATTRAQEASTALGEIVDTVVKRVAMQLLCEAAATIKPDWEDSLVFHLQGATVERLYVVWTELLLAPFNITYPSMEGGCSIKKISAQGCLLLHPDKAPLKFKASGVWSRLSTAACQQLVEGRQKAPQGGGGGGCAGCSNAGGC